MAKHYKTNSGRIIMRSKNGKFRKTTLADIGITVNSDYYVCNDCGFGEHDYRENERWLPIVKPDTCPNCKSKNIQAKKIQLSELYQQIQNEIEKNTRGTIDPVWMRNEYPELKRKLENEYSRCLDKSFDIPQTMKDLIDAAIEQENNDATIHSNGR